MDNRLSENFCLAMDQLIAKRLSGLSYNITRTCEIVDISKKKEGKYKVREGASIFEAFSDKTEYSIGDIVQVLIPNGDYDEQKIIQGKKIAENSDPYIFESPMSQILPLKKIEPNTQLSLLANGGVDNGSSITKVVSFKIDVAQVNKLVISADFKAWLSQYHLIEGSYGIKLYLYYLPKYKSEGNTTKAQENNKYNKREITLDSSEMIGNPYNFGSYFNQQKIVDVSDLNDIVKGEIVFYQSGNFKDYTGNSIVTKDFYGNILPDNLFVQNLCLYFGFLNAEYESDKAILFTKNTDNYNKTVDSQPFDEKYIELRWIHKDGESLEFIDDEKYNSTKYEIKWYRYVRGDTSNGDEYCGPHWVHWNGDGPGDDKSLFHKTLKPNIHKDLEKIKAICFMKPSQEESSDSDSDVVTVKQPIFSNELLFRNDGEVSNEATITQLTGLDFIIEDISNIDQPKQVGTNFFVYNQENFILEQFAGKQYRITVNFKKKNFNINTANGDSISWEILENPSLIINTNNAQNTRFMTFQLMPTYLANLNKCTIRCTLILDQVKYIQICVLNFGTQGTNGTDKTFILDFEQSNEKGFYLEDKKNEGKKPETTIKVNAYLYNASGEKIDLPENVSTEWSWRGKHENKCMKIINTTNNSCQIVLDTNNLNDLKNAINYSVLQAKLKSSLVQDETYDLVAYLSIPIRKNNTEYCTISGPTTIIYNYMGKPIYKQDPLYIYNQLGEKQSGIIWRVIPKPELAYEYDVPKIIKLVTGEYSIQVPHSYTQDNLYESELIGENNGTIIWRQPLLIFQNKYGISMLNSWDGDLTLDKKNGTILSTMLSAGSKDNKNQYSGVLIGDMHKATGNTGAILTGIYGFDHGVCSYSLTQDGKACFGVPGYGQIKLDGTSGTIESGNYSSLSQGMKINLADGHIDAFNFKLTGGSNLLLQSQPIDDDDYYLKLQSDDPNTGCITYQKDGTVNIIAKNLQVHSPIGGDNLIRNSAPILQKETVISTATSTSPRTEKDTFEEKITWDDNQDWTYPEGGISITSVGKKCNVFELFSNKSQVRLWQYIPEMIPGELYTLSGYFYTPKVEQALTIYNSTQDYIYINTQGKWEYKYFILTCNYESGINSDYIEFIAKENTKCYIWHPKIEKGRNHTAWNRHAEDLNSAISKADTSLDSSRVWAKLSNNGTLDGMWMHNQKLYISGTHIATGMLTSTNWDEGSKTGVCFNLNKGILTVYNNFTLNAGTINTKDYIGLYAQDEKSNITIGSESRKDWRIIAGNKFGVTKEGTLYASGAVVSGTVSSSVITGGTITGSKIQSSGKNPAFKVTEDGAVTCSSITITGGSIKIGNKFIVDPDGTLTAKNGIFTGSISGSSISGSTFTGANNKFSVDGTGKVTCSDIKITGGSLSISSDGHSVGYNSSGYFTATKADLTNLTVTDELYVTGTAHVGIGIKPDSIYSLKINGSIYVPGTGATYIGNSGGKLKFYSNGTWVTGNLFTIDTSYLQIGQSNSCAITVLPGSSFTMNGTMTINGSANFNAPEDIVMGGKTLPDYIRENSSTLITSVTTAQKLAYNNVLGQLINYSVGSKKIPVYFSNGVPKACDSLGDLAFLNSVKKKVNITMTGTASIGASKPIRSFTGYELDHPTWYIYQGVNSKSVFVETYERWPNSQYFTLIKKITPKVILTGERQRYDSSGGSTSVTLKGNTDITFDKNTGETIDVTINT